eukprot:295523_1
MTSAKQMIACSVCDTDRQTEPLYMCIKDNCSKLGEIFCAGCGTGAHKRKNHSFNVNEKHIKPIAVDIVQKQISGGLSVLKKTMNTHNEQQYSMVRQGYQAGLFGGALSYMVSDIMSLNDKIIKLGTLKGATDIGKQGLLMGTVTDAALEATKLAADGAVIGAVIMAGFEVALQTAKFINGDITTLKEYVYHVTKGLSASIGMGVGNWMGTTVGITIGTIMGGPIGGIIGGIVCGLFGGIAGVKTGRWVFDQVWSDDFIRNKQNGREQMIRDSLKLFGILDIKDIENREIFNQRELKKTYRSLAKRYHPDKNGGTPESHAKFHEINAALGVLLSILQRKNKKKLIKKLTEIRAIKWKNDVQRLGQILKEEKLLYIVDICTKWNKNITIEFLSKMRYEDILEMLKDLNEDEKYKYTVKVVERNRFVNAIQKWSGEDNESVNDNNVREDNKSNINSECKDDNDDIEYDEIEELRDELRKKKVLDVAEICKEIDTDLTLETLLEYTKSDLLQLINDINDDESNKHKISVIKKNKFVKIMQQEAKKQCELCVSK